MSHHRGDTVTAIRHKQLDLPSIIGDDLYLLGNPTNPTADVSDEVLRRIDLVRANALRGDSLGTPCLQNFLWHGSKRCNSRSVKHPFIP